MVYHGITAESWFRPKPAKAADINTPLGRAISGRRLLQYNRPHPCCTDPEILILPNLEKPKTAAIIQKIEQEQFRVLGFVAKRSLQMLLSVASQDFLSHAPGVRCCARARTPCPTTENRRDRAFKFREACRQVRSSGCPSSARS